MLSLDVALLVAGAQERGEVEARVSRLLSEAATAADVIFMCAHGILFPLCLPGAININSFTPPCV